MTDGISIFTLHLERFKSWLLGREYFKAVEALGFAGEYHTGMRKDGVTPEFHHQISIGDYTKTLPNLRGEELTLIVAILHDVMEDYNVSFQSIESRFGLEVATAVYILSKKHNGVKKSTEDYYNAMRTNYIASIVKGADRIHNLQTCSGVFTLDKQERYIEETEAFIFPMLEEARSNFPDQDLAYENIKYTLERQIELISAAITAQRHLNFERNISGNKFGVEVYKKIVCQTDSYSDAYDWCRENGLTDCSPSGAIWLKDSVEIKNFEKEKEKEENEDG